MEYKDIISVTGLPGLYQLMNNKSDGIIVRTLDGKNTQFVSARSHNFTPLESIEVFTLNENIPLSEVMQSMKKHEKDPASIDLKSKDDITAYFDAVIPDLDRERVYMSDMKKILKWYVLLETHDLLKFKTEEEQNDKKDAPDKTEEE